MMNNDQLKDLLTKWDSNVEFPEEESQFLTVFIPREGMHDLLKKMKEDSSTSFDYLFCLSGLDWPTHLEVHYHLKSTRHNHNILVKAKTDNRENAELTSVYDLWPTAEFHEREVYDLLGINFINHPNMKRLFLTDDWVGHPLRKDYVDEANMTVR